MNYKKYFFIEEKGDKIIITNKFSMKDMRKSSDKILQIFYSLLVEQYGLDFNNTGVLNMDRSFFEHSIFNYTNFRDLIKEKKYNIPVKKPKIIIILNKFPLNELRNGNIKISFNFIGIKYSSTKCFSSTIHNDFGVPALKTQKILKPDAEYLKNVKKYFFISKNGMYGHTKSDKFFKFLEDYENVKILNKRTESRIRYINFEKELKDGMFSNPTDYFIKKIIKSYSNSLGKNSPYVFLEYGEEVLIYKQEDYIKNLYKIIDSGSGTIEELRALLKEAKTISKKDINKSLVSNFENISKANCFEHQKEGITWLFNLYNKKLPGAVLADDMGMGKTFQTIGFLTAVNPKNVIIIAPASVVGVWENELTRFNPNLLKKVKIHSYQAFNSFSSKKEDSIKTDILILDEAQFIKNKNTTSSNTIREINSKFTIILSGTPIENSIEDIYNILGVLSKRFFDMYSFLATMAKSNPTVMAKITAEIIDGIYLRRMKTKDQLPAKFHLKTIESTMSINEKMGEAKIKEYYGNLLKRKAATNSFQYYNDIIVQIQKMIQNSSYQYQLFPSYQHLLPKDITDKIPSKALKVIELINKIPKEEKIVIFTSFIGTQDKLKELLKSYGVLVINGSVSSGDRKKIVDRFQNHEDERIILISLKAGNSGLTLHRANHVIIYDLWWNPAIIEQALARVYRIGQQRDTYGYMIVNKGSFDENIMKVVNLKKEIIGAFSNYDGEKDIKAGKDGNIIKQLAKSL